MFFRLVYQLYLYFEFMQAGIWNVLMVLSLFIHVSIEYCIRRGLTLSSQSSIVLYV